MHDVIIVGAGFAGLSAARSLEAAGVYDFCVLEARERVGGRTKHGTVGGLDIDLGGMWLGATQTRLQALADHYELSTYPTFLDGKAVFRIRGNEYHGEREDFDGMFGLWEGLEYLWLQRKLNRLLNDLDCEAPWHHPQATQLDCITLEQWLSKNLWSEGIRAVFRLACFSLFCAESTQVSMLFFLHYVKSGDGLDVLMSGDDGGAQNFLVNGGVHQIARRMSDELGDRLQLSVPVRRIEWTAEGVTIRTDNSSWAARRAIVAIPPPLLPKIEFSPALPQPKSRFNEHMNMGSAIKYWVAYERPFWREQGFNGFVARDDCPCTPLMDVTPNHTDKGILAGFFDGDHAVRHGDLSSDDRRQIVLGVLAEHFGEEARSPIGYVDADWTAEEWSGGCYGAYAPPGTFSHYGEWLRKPTGPISWAGTETSPVWTGYIEGAIRSGERAAAEVMATQK